MKRIMFIVVCVVIITSLAGCNMYRGLGKDVENTGRNIQGK